MTEAKDMKVETVLGPEITGQFSDLPLPSGLFQAAGLAGPDPLLALWHETELPDLPTSTQQIVDATLQLLDNKRQTIRSLERRMDAMTVAHQTAGAGAKTVRDVLERMGQQRAVRDSGGVFYAAKITELELIVLQDLARALGELSA